MLYNLAKRTIDLAGAIILLIIFLPVFIIVPILIKLDSKGPVFADTPKRVGKNKKLFRMFKFRSMIANAHQLLREDPKFKKLLEEYRQGSYKLKEDPRVTKVGRFLRHYSLDELPQIFNIIKGEMSLVGPRAYYSDELVHQQQVYPNTSKHVKKILTVKPGITGFWQVAGRSEVNFDKRVAMDAAYVERHSILEDVIIVLKTPWAMLSCKGAY